MNNNTHISFYKYNGCGLPRPLDIDTSALDLLTIDKCALRPMCFGWPGCSLFSSANCLHGKALKERKVDKTILPRIEIEPKNAKENYTSVKEFLLSDTAKKCIVDKDAVYIVPLAHGWKAELTVSGASKGVTMSFGNDNTQNVSSWYVGHDKEKIPSTLADIFGTTDEALSEMPSWILEPTVEPKDIEDIPLEDFDDIFTPFRNWLSPSFLS